MKKNFSVLLLLVVLCVSFVPMAIAKNRDVTPQAVTGVEVKYMDTSYNQIYSTSVGSTVLVRGDMHCVSTVLSDTKFELLLDNGFAQPSIVSGNVSPTLTYGYNSNFGYNCWQYRTGVLWYWPSADYNLTVSTTPNYDMTYKSMCGTDYTLSDIWATGYLYID